MSRSCLISTGLLIAFAVGCNSEPDPVRRYRSAAPFAGDQEQAPGGDAQDKPAAKDGKSSQISEQKIIYSAELAVVTKDLESAERSVREILAKLGGYVGDATVRRGQGSRPSATYQLRVPTDKYQQCLSQLAELGKPESRREMTQDVGEEYVDVTSRINNKKQIEQRLLELLKDRKGDLKEVIELESKLATVREEIERAQGRINYLNNRVALASIKLELWEEQNYVPPRSPDFTSRITDTWQESVKSVLLFFQTSVLFLIGIIPWIPVILVFMCYGQFCDCPFVVTPRQEVDSFNKVINWPSSLSTVRHRIHISEQFVTSTSPEANGC